MYEYMKKHEAFIKEELCAIDNNELDWLCDHHLKAILFVQHERLIHLLVTFFFGMLFIGSVIGSMIIGTLPFFLLDLIIVIVLGFYIRHYYRLENTVQHWYDLYKEMDFRRRMARGNE